MWGVVFQGITSVVQGWFETKREKQKAEAQYHMAVMKGEQDWDTEAMKASRFSWKDEFITIIIFAPLIVAWFDEEKALAWTRFVSEMPIWYQIIMSGIVAASFGLRWWFKQQNYKIGEKRGH